MAAPANVLAAKKQRHHDKALADERPKTYRQTEKEHLTMQGIAFCLLGLKRRKNAHHKPQHLRHGI